MKTGHTETGFMSIHGNSKNILPNTCWLGDCYELIYKHPDCAKQDNYATYKVQIKIIKKLK